jgi:hypothetical protein
LVFKFYGKNNLGDVCIDAKMDLNAAGFRYMNSTLCAFCDDGDEESDSEYSNKNHSSRDKLILIRWFAMRD